MMRFCRRYTAINRFGSFNEALVEADIPINDTWNNYSADEILSDVRTVARQNESIRPKYFGGGFVSRSQIDNKFDSISRAAGEANCHKYLPDYFECHDCGGLFLNIGHHISNSSCNFYNISDHEKNMYIGILMGDGSIVQREITPHFVVSMSGGSGDEFTKWLQEQITITSKRIEKRLDNSNHKTVYSLRTHSHEYFNNLAEWYNSGRKLYPNKLSLTPTILKMWYVSDGSLSNSGPIFTCWNESHRKDFLLSLFEDIGLSVTWQSANNDIYIRKESQDNFFEYIGEPVPGFEYKWGY